MIKEEDNVRTLLKYFQEVKDRYYKDKPEDTFNIFAAMRRKTEEVALHSRFIASLLDPYAPHGLDDVPLRLFLDTRQPFVFSLADFKHVGVCGNDCKRRFKLVAGVGNELLLLFHACFNGLQSSF